MSLEKIVLRGLLRHYWRKGLNANAATEQICQIEGAGVLHRDTAYSWFKRFKEGNISLEDKPRPGRPAELDDEDLLAALEAGPHSSTRELSATAGHSKTTIHRHLNEIGLVNNRPRQDLHELTDAQAERRVRSVNSSSKIPWTTGFGEESLRVMKSGSFYVTQTNGSSG